MSADGRIKSYVTRPGSNWTTYLEPTFGPAIDGFVGLDDVLCLMMMCYLSPDRSDDSGRRRDASRHILLEGSAGTGKSELTKRLARTLTVSDPPFARVQGTPDLMPSDFLGREVKENARDGAPAGTEGRWTFKPGPILRFERARGGGANPAAPAVLFVDELNRISPKTLSVLIDAMAENAVTLPTVLRDDRVTLERFFVVATQNPASHVGVNPVPEAVLDRFMVRVVMPYPGEDDVVKILREGVPSGSGAPADAGNEPGRRRPRDIVRPDWDSLRRGIGNVACPDTVLRGIAKVVRATLSASAAARTPGARIEASAAIRRHVDPVISSEAGVRAMFSMRDLGSVVAWARSGGGTTRVEMNREDVWQIAPYVLSHRLGFVDGACESSEEQSRWVRELMAYVWKG